MPKKSKGWRRTPFMKKVTNALPGQIMRTPRLKKAFRLECLNGRWYGVPCADKQRDQVVIDHSSLVCIEGQKYSISCLGDNCAQTVLFFPHGGPRR